MTTMKPTTACDIDMTTLAVAHDLATIAAQQPVGRAVMLPDGSMAPAITLGDINAALAGPTVTADYLTSIGYPPAGRDRAAKLYVASDLVAILSRIARDITTAALKA